MRRSGDSLEIGESKKFKIRDRIDFVCSMMAQGRFHVTEDCDIIIRGLSEAVYDPNSEGDVRLDNFSSDIDIFDCLCTPVQIVLHFVAEKPYFTEGETLRVTAPVAKAALTFPVTFIRGGGALASVIEESDFAVIQNPGDTDCPITAYLYAGGTVREPYIMLGDKKIRLTGNLAAGDTVKIESGDNRHRITVNGKTRSDIDRRSRFFCLEPGENRVTVSASAGAPSLRSYFEFEPRYFGI